MLQADLFYKCALKSQVRKCGVKNIYACTSPVKMLDSYMSLSTFLYTHKGFSHECNRRTDLGFPKKLAVNSSYKSEESKHLFHYREHFVQDNSWRLKMCEC